MKFEQTHWLRKSIKVMVREGCVYNENGVNLFFNGKDLNPDLEPITTTRTVFLARCGYEYFTHSYSHGPISEAMMWASREVAKCFLKSYDYTFDIIEFKLVEVKPTIRITLTSEGTDGVWTRVFQNFNSLSRDTLDELLLQDIKEAQIFAYEDSKRSGELKRLRDILQHAFPCIRTYDIILGGVLLGHLEYEVIK